MFKCQPHSSCYDFCHTVDRRRFLKNCGAATVAAAGSLTASLVHHTDNADWVIKEEQPKTAFGIGGRACHFGPEHGDCFDHHSVVYEYESGVKMYAHLSVQPSCYSEVSDIILGTKGKAHLMKNRIEGETNWRNKGAKVDPYQKEQDELFAPIRSGRPINNGRYMALSTMTGILGQIATFTGQKISLDQAIAAGNIFWPGRMQFLDGTAHQAGRQRTLCGCNPRRNQIVIAVELTV